MKNLLRTVFNSLIDWMGEKPPVGVMAVDGFCQERNFSVDICIVTNCACIGGTASTTLTEVHTFLSQGHNVLVVHCPVKRSFWKRRWISEKFYNVLNHIVLSNNIRAVKCSVLIVRGPRMVMTRNFAKLAPKIKAGRALFIVNNSAWNEDGKELFDWNALAKRISEMVPRSEICPIGPVIRSEGSRILTEAGRELLSPCDWPPAFNADEFVFNPRDLMKPPYVIGRHGRDHDGKWLEEPEALMAAYPLRSDVKVKIMGGAETVRKRLGYIPSNWEVQEFGSSGVPDYLSTLDVFVNFPAKTRDEAFGRTIVEAIFAGIPVILPHAFEPTFGDLAIYCLPSQVGTVIDRLAEDNIGRLNYVRSCRDEAVRRFDARMLPARLHAASHAEQVILNPEATLFRDRIMRDLA